jgi:hypothetical protein
MRRLYHYSHAEHGLDDLKKKRLKIARIGDLNDPFELWCSGQRDRRLREALRNFKVAMNAYFGLLCFSSSWKNPLLWSHYADRHRGMCLGFDVSESLIEPVNYVERRTKLKLPATEENFKHLLFTKYIGWSYEVEWRAWARLEKMDKPTGHFFRAFGDDIKLREVVVGPLSSVSKTALEKATIDYTAKPRLMKGRLAYQSFSVVQNKLGFRS